jgi:4-hydroxy-2-oxoheptanedioate aldolase
MKGDSMKWEKNKLKRILEESKIAVGTCIYSFSPALVEVAGFCGLDFCRIDIEHAWRQDENFEHMMRAAAISEIVALPRVDRNPFLIRKALEAGAGGIIVPHILNVEEVADVVKAAKFPPQGERGFGNLCFSGRWGTSPGVEWIKWSNEETMVGVMIEDQRAVEKIDEIMSVDGLDFVLFGPADYSVSLGIPVQTRHPKVMDGLKKIIDAAARHGKYVMANVCYPWAENAKKFIEMGCRLIEIGHDVTILTSMWRMLGEEIRGIQKSIRPVE